MTLERVEFKGVIKIATTVPYKMLALLVILYFLFGVLGLALLLLLRFFLLLFGVLGLILLLCLGFLHLVW